MVDGYGSPAASLAAIQHMQVFYSRALERPFVSTRANLHGDCSRYLLNLRHQMCIGPINSAVAVWVFVARWWFGTATQPFSVCASPSRALSRAREFFRTPFELEHPHVVLYILSPKSVLLRSIARLL